MIFIQNIINIIKKEKLLSLSIFSFFIFKLPYIFLPLYWDEPAYNDIRLWDDISLIFPWSFESLGLNSHPNSIQVLLGIFYYIFGQEVYVAHLLSLVISCFFIYYSIKTLEISFNKKIAFISTNLFVISPIFLAQSTQLLPDIPTLMFGVASFYYFLINSKWRFLLFAICLGLVAESGLAFSCGIILYALFKYYRKEISFRRLLLSFTPAISLGYYFIKQGFLSGRLIQHPAILQREGSGFSWLDINEENFKVLGRMNDFLWYNSGEYILVVLPLLALFLIFLKKKMKLSQLYFVSFSLAFYVFFFIYGDYHPRNIIPVYYCVMIMYGVFVWNLSQKNKYIGVFALILIAFFIGKQNFKPFDTGDSTIVTYIDETLLAQKTLRYFEDNKLQTPVYTTFPIAYFFDDVGSGYFKRKYDVIAYYSDGQWRYADRESAKTVIITSIEANHDDPEVNNWLKNGNWKLIKTFKNKFTSSWIYTRVE